MSGFSYSEYCPTENDPVGLLVVIRCSLATVCTQLSGQLKEWLPKAAIRGADVNELAVLFDDAQDDRDGLLVRLERRLASFNDQLAQGQNAEIVETRLVSLLTAEEPQDQICPCLLLDAKRSFGTGHHPSTRLAVRALEEIVAEGFVPARVLDVGTGSGILAMAASLFGARQAMGIDVCAESIDIARRNCARNRLDQVAFSMQPLAEIDDSFDLVLANVTGAVMGFLAKDLCRVLSNRGFLILSGLLGRQGDEMASLFADQGLSLIKGYSEGKWRALLLQR
jgi:ribosomal protein L11 methylase PrmA